MNIKIPAVTKADVRKKSCRECPVSTARRQVVTTSQSLPIPNTPFPQLSIPQKGVTSATLYKDIKIPTTWG